MQGIHRPQKEINEGFVGSPHCGFCTYFVRFRCGVCGFPAYLPVECIHYSNKVGWHVAGGAKNAPTCSRSCAVGGTWNKQAFYSAATAAAATAIVARAVAASAAIAAAVRAAAAKAVEATAAPPPRQSRQSRGRCGGGIQGEGGVLRSTAGRVWPRGGRVRGTGGGRGSGKVNGTSAWEAARAGVGNRVHVA